jgi:hypothetical protein
MNGALRFGGAGAAVLNRGRIFAGEGGVVGLLGSSVSNEGVIRAPLGKVALGSGASATLDFSGDGYLQVLLPAAAADAAHALVSNSGSIAADGGSVVLSAATARQAIREAVNMPGQISARSISGRDGRVLLSGGAGGAVRVAGAIDVSNAGAPGTGGRIDIGGDAVRLEGASLDAHGELRGGTVRVGGAYQGGRAQAPENASAGRFTGEAGAAAPIGNASTTSVDGTSRIDVSARGAQGRGGAAIVWSERATDMQGSVDARGAVAGGAVELSSAVLLRAPSLKKIALGAGGTLLLDPQDIQIDALGADPLGDIRYGAAGAVSHLRDADLTELLSTGATVTLQASQDILWSDNFSFVRRPPALTPGGTLNLSAGRSVTLSGIFHTAGGDWNIVANDSKANGVVDAERGAGGAVIDLRDANFINSNGKLALTLGAGAGNTERDAEGISIGRYQGDGLTARIAPDATWAGRRPSIKLTQDVDVSGNIVLSGDLKSLQPGATALTLSGHSVVWSDEKTGATLVGEGGLRFVEDGVTTRLGRLGGNDATRLALGAENPRKQSRVYGDADPAIGTLAGPQLHRAAHSVNAEEDALGAILLPNSLAVVGGPGRTANVGNYTLAISATAGAGIDEASHGSYFIDLSPAAVALRVTPRMLTATLASAAYTYGAPTALVRLSNVANGDQLAPLVLWKDAYKVLTPQSGGGFGLDARVGVGAGIYSIIGLSGELAENYRLETGRSAPLTIAPKPLNYAVQGGGGNVYGTAGTLPSATLSGVLEGDAVSPLVGISAAGVRFNLTPRLAAGAYTAGVAGLAGAAAGNYSLAAAGNTDADYLVSRKAVNFPIRAAVGTYGTLTRLDGGRPNGVLPGDEVFGVAQARDGTGKPVDVTATLAAGSYSWNLWGGLSGAGAGNYVWNDAAQPGAPFSVLPKAIRLAGGVSSQVYGAASLPKPVLDGLVGADQVFADPVLLPGQSWGRARSGAYNVGRQDVTVGSLSGADSANYVLQDSANALARIAITPRALNYQVASANTVYGALAALPATTLSGVVAGDALGAVTGSPSGAGWLNFAAKTPVGNYLLNLQALSGADAGNYLIAGSGNTLGQLSIAPKTLTLQLAGGSAVYGDGLGHAVALAGLLAGDAVLPELTALDGAGAPLSRPAVGSYRVAATGLSGADAGNYALAGGAAVVAAVAITPRPVYYAVAASDAVYGTLAGAGAVTLSNLMAGDSVAAAIHYSGADGVVALGARTRAGVYTQAVSGLTGNPNYVLAGSGNQDGRLTIAPLVIRNAAPDASSVYGTQAVLGVAALTGILPGDVVAAGATLLRGGALPGERLGAGSYPLMVSQLSGPDAGNYALAPAASASGQLLVAPKAINYALATEWRYSTFSGPGENRAPNPFGGEPETMVYGQFGADVSRGQVPLALPTRWLFARYGSVEATLSGVLAGDGVGMETRAPLLPSSTSGAYNVGTYRWTGGSLSGAAASNYVLAGAGNRDKVLTITPAPLDVMHLVGGNALGYYNGAQYGSADALRASGQVSNPNTRTSLDQVAATVGFVTPQGRVSTLPQRLAVGTYATYLAGLSGPDAGNYVAVDRPADVTISPKTLRVSAAEQYQVYGSVRVDMGTTLQGLLDGDNVAVATSLRDSRYSPQNPQARLPAGDYFFHLDGLTGADAGNYRMEGVASQLAAYLWRSPVDIARVRVRPLKLGVSSSASQVTATYGDLTVPTLTLSGVLPGDEVGVAPMARPNRGNTPNEDLGYQYQGVSSRLGAGGYAVFPLLSGAAARNYAVPTHLVYDSQKFISIDVANAVGTIDVKKRPVVFHDVDLTYGERRPYDARFSNLLAGDWISADLMSPASSYPAAGSYSLGLANVRGRGLENYVVPDHARLTVARKMLTWTPNPQLSMTYGDAFYGQYPDLGTLSGFASYFDMVEPDPAKRPPGIKENGYSTMQITTTVDGNTDLAAVIKATTTPGGEGLRLQYSGYNKRAYDYGVWLNGTHELSKIVALGDMRGGLIDAGKHTIFAAQNTALVGGASENYLLPANMPTTLTVEKRAATYSVANIVRQYGNYQDPAGGQPNAPGKGLGFVTYGNVLPMDKYYVDYVATRNDAGFKQNMGLIGADGALGTEAGVTARTPVGSVFFEVVNSIDNKNYRLASSGNKAGVLQIIRRSLFYSTSSAIYLPGTGMVGTPGVATLSGMVNGEQPSPYVTATDPNGRVVADLNSLQAGRYQFKVSAIGGKDAGNYVLNAGDIGTLDVFPDVGLGMRLASTTLPAPTVAPSFRPAASLPQVVLAPVPPAAPAAPDPAPTAAGGAEAGTRTSADAGASAGTTALGAQANANGVAGVASDLGAGTTGGAQASAEATAACGPLGCRSAVNGKAMTYLEWSNEKLSLAAEAQARLKLALGLSGVQLSATSVLQAAVEIAGSHGAGAAGQIDYSAATAVYATAGAQATASWDNGVKIVTDEHVGVGVKAGGAATLKGDAGSVSGGASVYTPGSLGGQFSISPGYSDGTLSVSLNLGAQLGIGGLNVNLGFSINFASAGETIGGWFSSDNRTRYQKSRDHAYGLKPAERIAYLRSTDDWRRAGTGTQGLDESLARYASLESSIRDAQQTQVRMQDTFLGLLKTDPAAAIAYAHKTDITAKAAALDASMFSWARYIGVRLDARDGQMAIADY